MRFKSLLPLLLVAWSAHALTVEPVAGRTAYQTNEAIAVAVVRSQSGAAELTALLAGEGVVPAAFTFALPGGRAAEYLWLDARLLRPGAYTLRLAVDGETAETAFEVYSHLRRSTFRLVNWSPIRAGKEAGREPNHLAQGEARFGYNAVYSQTAGANPEALIRAGVDFIPNCVAGGGHQPELRIDCDWSDPYVLGGVIARGSRFALAARAYPNVPMIHLYDEPGLTWYKSPVTGEFTPHDVPTQVRAFEAATGRAYLPYHQVDPANPEHVARWTEWARWKLSFMEAAWRLCRDAIEDVDPAFQVATQSQYGWSAFTDGYYFNVVRSLPITSGHGGYHDLNLSYFTPCFFLTMARARDLDSPTWYLPTWYGNTTGDQLRAEQYLSFITGIQGLVTPPPLEPTSNPIAADAIAETNQAMARLGTIFTVSPTTRQPVAILYSLSSLIHTQLGDMTQNYAHSTRHGKDLNFAYLACKLGQYLPQAVVEEDLLDGSLAASHRAVLVAGVDYLAPEVVAALEQFVADGGLVLAFDSPVAIRGAVDLGIVPALPGQARIDQIHASLASAEQAEKAAMIKELQQLTSAAANIQGARPLRDRLVPALTAAGIAPIFTSSVDTIVAGSHRDREITYYFAVNATPDGASEDRNAIQAATAAIALPVGANLYDAMTGQPATQFRDGRATFEFGPGQMRVWAAAAHAIADVTLSPPALDYRLTGDHPAIALRFAATVRGAAGQPLYGPIPLRVELADAAGKPLFDLYRAAAAGTLDLALPLGANLPAGACRLTVTELLSGRQATADIAHNPSVRPGAVAGLEARAIMLAGERRHLFRFGRRYRQVTLVPGAGEASAKAAERLAGMLAPWGIRCQTIPADQANRPRPLTEEEASTWVGRSHTGKGSLKAGAENPIQQVGFDLPGPAILLGTPANNPLIAFLANPAWKYLPWAPRPGLLPAAGRGYIAWQRDALVYHEESIALIGEDDAALTEAVGTLYEAIVGLEPLTPWLSPAAAALESAP